MIEVGLDIARRMAIEKGVKIRHKYFDEHEYIYFKNGDWFTEDGFVLPVTYFFRLGEGFKTGWSEFKT